MTRDDGAMSSVVGAMIVLTILGGSLLYVNAFYVPRQGAAMEVQGAEKAEASLLSIVSALQSSSAGPSVHELPLQAERGTPPLLSGVILSPARPSGTLAVDEGATRLRVFALLNLPAGGIAADDPIREQVDATTMRLHFLGNNTSPFPAGALSARVGGAYTDAPEYRVEAGLLLANRSAASVALGQLGLFVEQDAYTSVAWRVPLIGGGEQSVAGAAAQLALRPGPESELGGSRVRSVTILVETENVAAWREALEDAIGAAGTVTTTQIGAADNGTVEATIVPPSSVPAGTAGVELRLWAVRYEATLAAR